MWAWLGRNLGQRAGFVSVPRDFGLVVAIDVAAALLSALVVLPPVLRWADQRRWVWGR